MNDENQLVVKTSVSLYPEDIALLHQVGKDYGLGSKSAAARHIIREWYKMKRLQMHIAGLMQACLGGYITAEEVVDELLSRPSLLAVSDREGS